MTVLLAVEALARECGFELSEEERMGKEIEERLRKAEKLLAIEEDHDDGETSDDIGDPRYLLTKVFYEAEGKPLTESELRQMRRELRRDRARPDFDMQSVLDEAFENYDERG